MAQSLVVNAKTHLQGTSYKRSFEHGSRLQIPPSIITSHAKLNTEGLQGGLLKVAHFKTGRRVVPYCGSMEIVRSSYLFLLLPIDCFPDFAAGAGKSILWYAPSCLPLSLRETYTVDKLCYY